MHIEHPDLDAEAAVHLADLQELRRVEPVAVPGDKHSAACNPAGDRVALQLEVALTQVGQPKPALDAT